MPEENQNTGSFMAPAGGGGGAIQEAMERRGMGGSGALNQVGPGSPTFPSAAQMPSSAGVPAPAPQPQVSQPGVPAGGAMPVGKPEAEIILGALNERLKTLSAVDKAKAGIMK